MIKITERNGKTLKNLRICNINDVLKALSQMGMCSRGDLAKQLELSKMTITNIVSYLNEKCLIEEKEYKSNQYEKVTGPKPMMLSIKRERILSIGVCITKDDMQCALVDIVQGTIIDSVQYRQNAYSKNSFIHRLSEMIEQMINKYEFLYEYIIGIGISCTGLVDSQRGILYNHMNGNINIDLRKLMLKRYDVPTFLLNDVQAYTIAEHMYGAGRNKENFILLSIGNGIAAGLVIDGKLYKGNNGYVCEAGHMSVNYKGERCSCGNRGCYELYATTALLLRKTKCITVEEMINKYVHKDPLTIRVMEEFVQVTSIVLTNLVNTFDPECVIIGSIAPTFPKNIIKQIEYQLNLHCIQRRQKYIKVLTSTLQEPSMVLGAASITFDQLFRGNIEL